MNVKVTIASSRKQQVQAENGNGNEEDDDDVINSQAKDGCDAKGAV